MTVDNRNQDDEDGYTALQKVQNAKCDFKDNEAMSSQVSPLEKVYEKLKLMLK